MYRPVKAELRPSRDLSLIHIVLGEAGVYEFSLRAALQAVDYNVLLMMAGTMGTVAQMCIRDRYQDICSQLKQYEG